MAYETDERVAELTEKLEKGVVELYASDNYAQYMVNCLLYRWVFDLSRP